MRDNQNLVSATIDGVDLGVFDTFEGGDADSDETKYFPGGMAPQRTLGGLPMVTNVTVGRLYDLARDHDIVRGLMNRQGKAQMTVSKQPLDIDGNPFGRPIIYHGILKTITPPKSDSNSNSASVWTAVLSTEGSAG